MWRLALSFVIAAVGGIPLDILMGLSPLADDLIDPLVELLWPISGIAWLPLALFIFGIGNELPILIDATNAQDVRGLPAWQMDQWKDR